MSRRSIHDFFTINRKEKHSYLKNIENTQKETKSNEGPFFYYDWFKIQDKIKSSPNYKYYTYTGRRKSLNEHKPLKKYFNHMPLFRDPVKSPKINIEPINNKKVLSPKNEMVKDYWHEKFYKINENVTNGRYNEKSKALNKNYGDDFSKLNHLCDVAIELLSDAEAHKTQLASINVSKRET